MKGLLGALALATSLLAQGPGGGDIGRFAGPVLGFVAGAGGSELQPIYGLPGAARMGDALALPANVKHVFLAPGHQYGIAALGAADAAAVVAMRTAGVMFETPIVTALSGGVANPALVGFSPGARSVALYSQAQNRIQIWTGMPAFPRLAATIAAPDAVTALALSDDAQVAVAADAGGNVYALTANGRRATVYHGSQISAVVFFAGVEDAAIADAGAGSVALVRNVAAGATVTTLLPPANAQCRPAALAVASDANTVLAACPAQKKVWSYNLASGASNTYDVPVAAAALDYAGVVDAFLMSPDEHGTYWLLEWRNGAPVASFVGAARHGAAAGAGN